MRIEEAKYIGNLVKRFIDTKEGRLLNIGSSTEEYRKITSPYIDAEIFAPLNNLNIKITHFDLKNEKGVDIAGDIFDSKIQNTLEVLKPNLIMACNLLEHLEQDMRKEFPQIINRLFDKEGILIITVPYSYPLHLDPIDTFYRPSPKELSSLFANYEVLDSTIINSSTFFDEFLKYNLFYKLKTMIRIFTPFYKFKVWLCLMHRLMWLFRPYKITCVALKKI